MAEFADSAAHPNELCEHESFRKAVKLLADPDVPLTTLSDYAFGQAWVLSCAALAALRERSDGASIATKVAGRFDQLSVWQMEFALHYLVNCKERLLPSAPLTGYRDWWSNNAYLRHLFADYFSTLGEDASDAIDGTMRNLPTVTKDRIRMFLGDVRHPLAGRIAAHLGAARIGSAASSFLTELGRFWDEEVSAPEAIEPECWAEGLATAKRTQKRTPPRSLLVSGEPLVGKTSFLRLLAKSLAAEGWRVFEASGADLQAGQIYIGELEGRIRRALEELDSARKIIWYVPDPLQLALSGTHSGQSATILDQILPAIAQGRLLIWTEAAPKSTVRLLQLRPALRRIVEVVRIEPMSAADTRGLAQSVSQRLVADRGFAWDESLADTAIEAAQHYLSATSLPGSALALIRLTVERTEKRKGQLLTGRDTLETLSQLTGLPLSILDGQERLKLADIRTFFTERVIGQPEALEAIVRRIAMLKSGLNDPNKPIAVFLFAGPTGTGKTELAKALTEYLFGSVERMIRLDMSEYQAADTVTKILGGANQPSDAETLVSRIRKQPFSLVLLDEFEKSAPQIWDLFLQVFDEGRLTDALGHTADFRHCLVILTTNLGATAHEGGGIGFTPSAAFFTGEQILRAISHTFRPEFQNRLDKIIVFRPLTRDLMRGILKKELARALERRGLRHRDWAVEWDPSALEFLIEKGFSPAMGARPLKRAIEEYVIAPLAETIVERRFPEGDQFVFVRREGDQLAAEFVDPDAHDEAPAPQASAASAPESLGSRASGTAATTGGELDALARIEREIDARIQSEAWSRKKHDLAAAMSIAEFWATPERFATLTRLELMDRLEVAAETASSLAGRLARRGAASGNWERELRSRLSLQLRLVEAGLKDLDENVPPEAAVLVEAAFETGVDDKVRADAWREGIVRMYAAWAENRRMSSKEIQDVPGLSYPVRLVAGFGAWRTLSREVGLHVLEDREGGAGGSRLAVRVVIVAPPLGMLSRGDLRQALGVAFNKVPGVSSVVRRYRRTPSPLVRNASGNWRSGRLEEVLAGDFDILTDLAV
jgi:ATP-dependent Clp protease ATP-binding subunit ClpC